MFRAGLISELSPMCACASRHFHMRFFYTTNAVAHDFKISEAVMLLRLWMSGYCVCFVHDALRCENAGLPVHIHKVMSMMCAFMRVCGKHIIVRVIFMVKFRRFSHEMWWCRTWHRHGIPLHAHTNKQTTFMCVTHAIDASDGRYLLGIRSWCS